MKLSKFFQHSRTSLEKLTPRELDVLSCLLENSASKKIALILKITIETIDTHIANIGRKLEQNGRVQIVDCIRQSEYVSSLHQRYLSLVEGPEFERILERLKEDASPWKIVCTSDYVAWSLKKRIAKAQRKVSLLLRGLFLISFGVLGFIL